MSEPVAYPPSATESRSKPVRALYAVAAGATAVSAGLPLLTPDRFDWVGPALGLLGVVITVAMGKYTEGNVTPTEDVAVKRISTDDGYRYVAAPALPGVQDGLVVNKPTTVKNPAPDPFEGGPL